MAARGRVTNAAARCARSGIPTWLAQPAAMVPGSKLIDAPPDGLTVDQVAPLAKEYDAIVMHTSTPSFNNDARFAARLKEENPDVSSAWSARTSACFPSESLRGAPAVDWVSVGEFDYTCVDVASGQAAERDRRPGLPRERQHRPHARASDHHRHGRVSVGARRLSPRS